MKAGGAAHDAAGVALRAAMAPPVASASSPPRSEGRATSSSTRAISPSPLAGATERIEFGSVVEFDPEACDHCRLRANCTATSAGSGRTVAIAENERLQHRLRKQQRTPTGRASLRERVAVEHKLAHIGRGQGRRARYRGVRKNLFDLRRACVIQNFETIQRKAG
jgi:hypothetical protein